MSDRDALQRRIIRDFLLMFAAFSAFVFALAFNIKPGHIDFAPGVVATVLVSCGAVAAVAVCPKLLRLRRLTRDVPAG